VTFPRVVGGSQEWKKNWNLCWNADKFPCNVVNRNSDSYQGCQMVYLNTKNPDLGIFWRAFEWKILVYLMATWNILPPRGTFYGVLVYFVVIRYIFPRFGMLFNEKSLKKQNSYWFLTLCRCENVLYQIWYMGRKFCIGIHTSLQRKIQTGVPNFLKPSNLYILLGYE
jgi:hypothetical protein